MTLIQLGGYLSEYITYLLAKLIMASNYCPCFVHVPSCLIPKSSNGGKSLS